MSKTLPEIHRQFNAIRRHFQTDMVKEAVQAACEHTTKWLKEARQSYNPDGTLNLTRPWWPDTLRKTDDPVYREERAQAFRYHLFEHGFFSYYECLEMDAPAVFDHDLYFDPAGSRTAPERWHLITNGVTDPATKPIIGHLVMRAAANLPPLSQRAMGDLYRYAEGGQKKVRRRLKEMAPIGLIDVYANSGYANRIGALSEAFYLDVYSPFVQAYNDDSDGWRK